MEVLNARSALLSNFEVLGLLRELDSDYLAKTKTAHRIKKEEDQSGKLPLGGLTAGDEICENLRTVEVEAIQYLTADYQPIASQSDAGIARLVKDIAPYGLTKAEKLQVVNLAPAELVELYVIVEELEDRLGDRMEDVLAHVKSSLDPVAPLSAMSNGADSGANPGGVALSSDQVSVVPEPQVYVDEETWIQDANYIEWDDMGHGAGIEGDLEMDED